MIVRDEEAFLGDCLKSIAGEVDEIVIVDTGSVDRTREIARDHGARVFEHPWSGDFAAARNRALDHAGGDWILYIDADERLSVPEPGALRAVVAGGADVVAFQVLFQPQVNYTPYRELRLFRRDDRIRFRGVIHESVHPDLERVARNDGLTFALSDIGLVHVGYEGDLTHKHRRNLPLLEEAVRVTPERVFLWADMARALAGLGRRGEAEEACWRAIGVADASDDAKQEADAAPAWECLVGLHLEGDAAHAAALARRATAALPEHLGLRLILANALFATGEAEPILPLLEGLVAIDAETFQDALVAYDRRIFGEWPYDLLGAVHARMGRREEAALAFAQASKAAPDNLAYRVKAAALSGRGAPPDSRKPLVG